MTNMLPRIHLVLVSVFVCHSALLQGQDKLRVSDLSQTYQNVVPSVVYIEVGSIQAKTGSGSGFIVHADGYIATAAHVVDEADVVMVTFHDESSCQASIVTMARSQDLALLKVEKLPAGMRPATLGNPSKVTAGQPVFCVGSPYDLKFSISAGVVSAVREDLGATGFVWKYPSRIIQTDTAINPGNSGGPIFNYDGEVIGIAVGTLPKAEGIGLAVPGDLIRRYLVDEAVPFGGVIYLRVTPEFAGLMNWPAQEALIVERIQLDSFAEKSGLRGGRMPVSFEGLSIMLGGDVIYTIGGHRVSEYDKVREYLRALTEKDEIKMSVLREGKMVELRAPFKTLDPMPSLDLPGVKRLSAAQPRLSPRKAKWAAQTSR